MRGVVSYDRDALRAKFISSVQYSTRFHRESCSLTASLRHGGGTGRSRQTRRAGSSPTSPRPRALPGGGGGGGPAIGDGGRASRYLSYSERPGTGMVTGTRSDAGAISSGAGSASGSGKPFGANAFRFRVAFESVGDSSETRESTRLARSVSREKEALPPTRVEAGTTSSSPFESA